MGLCAAAPTAFGLLLLTTLLGCGPPPVSDIGITNGVEVDNQTPYDLHYETIVDGTVYKLGYPGHRGRDLIISANQLDSTSLIGSNGCTKGDVVALTPEGREFARHKPPLCVNDIWVIGATGASPTSS